MWKFDDWSCFGEWWSFFNHQVCYENSISDLFANLNSIFISILDSYIQEPPKAVERMRVEKEEEIEVISLDSDDESVIVKDENVTLWYSNYLKT